MSRLRLNFVLLWAHVSKKEATHCKRHLRNCPKYFKITLLRNRCQATLFLRPVWHRSMADTLPPPLLCSLIIFLANFKFGTIPSHPSLTHSCPGPPLGPLLWILPWQCPPTTPFSKKSHGTLNWGVLHVCTKFQLVKWPNEVMVRSAVVWTSWHDSLKKLALWAGMG